MTAEIVNLRVARKRQARAAAGETAAANRAAYGTSGAQKRLGRAIRDKAERALDAHKLTPDDSTSRDS